MKPVSPADRAKADAAILEALRVENENLRAFARYVVSVSYPTSPLGRKAREVLNQEVEEDILPNLRWEISQESLDEMDREKERNALAYLSQKDMPIGGSSHDGEPIYDSEALIKVAKEKLPDFMERSEKALKRD
jgi:hypothetical protein